MVRCYITTADHGVSIGSTNQWHGHDRVSTTESTEQKNGGGGQAQEASRPSTGRVSLKVPPTASSPAAPPSHAHASVAKSPSLSPASRVVRPPERPSSVLSSTAATTPVATLTVSVDGLLLFIGDTNIFPMLSFEVRGEPALLPGTVL